MAATPELGRMARRQARGRRAPGQVPPYAEVQAEQVAAIFRQTPLAILVSAVNAALMVAVLRATAPDPRALVWLALVLGVAALRYGLCRAYRQDRAAALKARGWGLLGMGGAVLAGLVWGVGAAWLWPDSESDRLFWVFVVGGMCAGAATLHYAHLPTALGFILPAGLPLAARFALEGDGHGFATAAMVAVFLAALAVTCRRSSAHFADYLMLRLNLARQAQALDDANSRLRREIDDHRNTEASLRHAQKMEAVGQLTGGIAHDFNNLLTAVLGSLALLRKRLPAGDERGMRLLDNAVQGATRGAVLTQRLLAFGRRQALRPEVVDLPALVAGMSDLLRRSIGAGHRLATHFPAGLPPIRIDANQLELALLNLSLNARDAMPAGGTVRITARASEPAETRAAGLPAGGYVVVSVTDRGEGMDEATLARATEPFFTTKGAGKGTGLGLSMAHGLAAQSGGRLVLQSTPGQGTTAALWLPRAAAAPSGRPVAVAAPSLPTRPLNVLLVDDDPLVLASAAAMLEDLGHQVIEADSGATALTVLRGGAIVEVVITDYAMPDMTGVQLAEAVRRGWPGLPVLLASGYGDLAAAEAAGLPRLAKPFGQAALNAAIEGCMGHARA